MRNEDTPKLGHLTTWVMEWGREYKHLNYLFVFGLGICICFITTAPEVLKHSKYDKECDIWSLVSLQKWKRSFNS